MDEESPKPLNISKFFGRGEESLVEAAAPQPAVKTPILSGGFDLSNLLNIINTQIDLKSESDDLKEDVENIRLQSLVDSLTGRVNKLTSELSGLFSLIIGDIKERDSQKRAELKLAIQQQSEISKAVALQALQQGAGQIAETSEASKEEVVGTMESNRQMDLLTASLGLGAGFLTERLNNQDNQDKFDYPGGTLSMKDLVNLAEQVGFKGDNIPLAAAIAMGESRGDPAIDTVKSGTDPDMKKEYSIGLWQINWLAHKGGAALTQLGVTNPDQLRDPMTNAKAALAISGGSNFSPWTVYTGGTYKAYLDSAKKEYEGSTNNNQQASATPAAQTQPIASASLNKPAATGDPSSAAKISTPGAMVSVAQVELDTKTLMQDTAESQNMIAILPPAAKQQSAPASSVSDASADATNPIFSAVNRNDPYPASIALQTNVVV
jgi:hypothetical protein